MPVRWWLPLSDPVNPHRIGPHHTHAAVASWLDPINAMVTTKDPAAEHGSTLKPWFTSPVSRAPDGSFGIEISTLTDAMSEAVDAGPLQGELRLGTETLRVGPSREIRVADWGDLSRLTEQRRWTVAFLTPTCFRLRGRSGVSPLPAPEAILRGLDNYWTAYSRLGSRLRGHESLMISVTRCDIETHEVPIGSRGQGRGPSHVPGFVGELVFEATTESAALVGPLFELVDFVSIGSFARRGLGVARLVRSPKDRNDDTGNRQPDPTRGHRVRPPRGGDNPHDGDIRAVG